MSSGFSNSNPLNATEIAPRLAPSGNAIAAGDAPARSSVDWIAAKGRVLRIRKRAAAAMIDLFDEIRALTESAPEDSPLETWLQNECGVSSRDLSVIRGFHDTLGEHASLLKNRGVTFQTVKALVSTDAKTRGQALRRIDSGLSIDEVEIAYLRQCRLDAARSDETERLRRRRKWVNKVGQHRSKERIHEIEDVARQLRDHVITFQSDFATYMVENWHDDRPYDNPKYEVAHRVISALAGRALDQFESMFGKQHARIPDWEHLRLEDPEAAAVSEAYEVLRRLSHGQFGLSSGFGVFADASLDVLDSDWMVSRLAYLAGIQTARQENERSAPRNVKSLTALELCAGAGGEAIGLMAAGFKTVALYDNGLHQTRTMMRNWPHWNVRRANLKHAATINEISELEGSIDLISGGVPCQSFSKAGKRRGAKDERQLFTTACEIVKKVKPKAFYFENVVGFLEGKHEELRRELSKEFSGAGYDVKIFTMRATDYGLPQRRERIVVLGMPRELISRFELPLPREPLVRSLGEWIGPVVFPYYSVYRGSEAGRILSKEQLAYDRWVEWWLEKYGSKTAPTVVGWQKGSSRQINAWKDAGFDQAWLSDFAVAVGDQRDGMLPPLTIDMLKRLQGFPDAWQFASNDFETNMQMIANAFPPVMARALGHAIHDAISGEKIDVDLAIRDSMIDEGKIGVSRPRPVLPKKRGRPKKQFYQRRTWLAGTTRAKSRKKPEPHEVTALSTGLRRPTGVPKFLEFADDPRQLAAARWRDEAELRLYGDDPRDDRCD